MKSFLLSLCLLFATALHATSVGTWTLYQAYNDAQECAPVSSSLVYARYAGNLLAYNPTTEEVRFITKNDGLTGTTISRIVYSTSAHCLVVVYDDLNIDLVADDGTVYALPQIKNADDGSLTVNDITLSGTDALLAMSNGVAVVNLTDREITGYYNMGRTVRSAVEVNGYIYAAAVGGVYVGAMSNNLSDPNNWKFFVELGGITLYAFGDGFYLLDSSTGSESLWWVRPASDGTTVQEATWVSSEALKHGFVLGDSAVFYGSSVAVTYAYSAPTTAKTTRRTLPTNLEHLAATSSGQLWAACGMSGLYACRTTSSAISTSSSSIGGYGPRRDYCYYLHYEGTRLLIAGGRLDPFDEYHYEGTIMKRDGEQWVAFQEDSIEAKTGVTYRDITCVAQDPNDAQHHFATSTGGLYEFRSGEFVKHYTIDNSPLVSSLDSSHSLRSRKLYVRLDGLNYDDAGNLWLLNNDADSAICVLRTDGTWSRIYESHIAQAPTLEKTLFDTRGRLWVCSRRTVNNHTAGLLCLDYNGTIDDDTDDVSTYRTSGYNEDGTAVDISDGVYDIVQDTDGSLWVGTAAGLFVITDPDSYSSSNVFQQIKVPRNDGTNYADYLLDGVGVTAIAIDGADRKWIGTASNGVYLVSADGTEILQHFLAAETPLLSDAIYDIAINPTSGEVMIGTDAGLCSYMSDATPAAESLDKNAVRVYPNPVRPEYSGNVTVTGLTASADVKVVSTGGQVVAAGTSNGGTFTWDCCGRGGFRVSTGVYYIMVSTADGKNGIVAKVVVI